MRPGSCGMVRVEIEVEIDADSVCVWMDIVGRGYGRVWWDLRSLVHIAGC